MTASSKLKGFDKCKARLKSLPRRVAGPIAAKALTAGMMVAVAAIRNISPPYVAQTVGYRLAAKTTPSIMRGIVGIHVGKHASNDTRWAAIQVVGSKERFRRTKSGGTASTGRIVGNNVVQRGMAASASQVKATIRSVLKNELSKIKL